MKLYYSPGVCSQAVHIALNEAAIEHEIVRVDLATKKTEHGDDFTDINALGYVPALVLDSGEVLLEAPAILQYIADQRPEAGLAPANGTIERARLQAHLNFTASELHKSFGPFFAPIKPEGDLREQALTKLRRRLDQFETQLAEASPYVLGEKFSVADAYAFVVATWTNMIGLDINEWPNIAAYVARLMERPSIKATREREGLAA